ncbi:hypothetical protein Aperf_G00000010859 [Anoplocephala perfoliata]
MNKEDETRIFEFPQYAGLCLTKRIYLEAEAVKFILNYAGLLLTPICNMSATHSQRNGPERTHKCEICSKTFDRPSHLERHKATHSNDRRFQCAECGKAFITQYALHTHERIHANHKLYACALCDARFTDGSNLAKHVRRVHSEGEIKQFTRVKCPACDTAFPTFREMKNHQVVHIGERRAEESVITKFTCAFCTLEFDNENSLSKHQQTHTRTDENPSLSAVNPSSKPSVSAKECKGHVDGSSILVQQLMQPNDLTDSSIMGQNRISSPQSQLPPTNYSPHSPVSVTIPCPKPNTQMLGQQRTAPMILEQPLPQQLQTYNDASEDLHQVHTRQANFHCGFEKLVQRIQVAHFQSATTPPDSISINQLLASPPLPTYQNDSHLQNQLMPATEDSEEGGEDGGVLDLSTTKSRHQ